MSSISFGGLATGLDTGSIIAQLVELKRAPIYRLESRKKGFESQISAMGTLKSKLMAIQTAAEKIGTASDFSSLTASSNDEDILTVETGEGAAPGTYDIMVTSLATTQKDSSQAYASMGDSVGQGTMSFTVDGETTDLTLTGFNSLESLRDMINNDVTGVSATIINDGSEGTPYRLVLSGAEAGSAGAFTVDASGLSGGLPPAFTNQQMADDAVLTIDGLPVTATSNKADEVISGLTLNLKAGSEGQIVRVTVETDTEGISDNVKALMDAYNDFQSFVDTNTKQGGDLRQNPTVRSVSSRIRSIFSSPLEAGLGDITMLAQVGITRGSESQLEWDADDFTDALKDDFASVRDLFIDREGNRGLAVLIDEAVEEMTDSQDGLFKISKDALDKKIEYADSGIERYERSVESYRTTLERKFTAMEMMVAQLQSQGGYLGSIQQ